MHSNHCEMQSRKAEKQFLCELRILCGEFTSQLVNILMRRNTLIRWKAEREMVPAENTFEYKMDRLGSGG